MTKMTKEQRDALIASTHQDLRIICDKLTEKYSVHAENAQKNIRVANAVYLTAAFATFAVDYGINLEKLFAMCDKTHKRFVTVYDNLTRGDLSLVSVSDQNRYTFDLARSALAAHKQNAMLTKADTFASATKVENAPEYVTISTRKMADSTANRQSGIARTVLTVLGLIVREESQNGKMLLKCNTKSACFKRFAKLIASGE